MPFALLLIGAVLILTAIKGTYAQLGSQLSADFTGSGSANFLVWLAAIGAVGALGYAPVLRTPSRMLLALILLAMIISNKGVFAKLTSALSTAPAAVQGVQDPALTGSVPISIPSGAVPVKGETSVPVPVVPAGGGGGGAGDIIGQAAGFLGLFA